MDSVTIHKRHSQAARELNEHLYRDDGQQIIDRLCSGLNLLRELLYTRVHEDVQREFGIDSSLAPLSEPKAERVTKLEIEIYQVVISYVAACDYGYVPHNDDRFLDSLGRLRLGESLNSPSVTKRIDYYFNKGYSDRRLAFSDVLAHAFRGSRKAPLVIFRLFPRAIQLVTATAFDDPLRAGEIRNEQVDLLPEIPSCEACHGRPLSNNAQCGICGNPLWNFDWLNQS